MSHSSRTKLGLAIPTLNEAGNMRPLLEGLGVSLARVPIDYELIVVDDDSSDGTADVAREYAKQDPRVRVFVRRGQRGLHPLPPREEHQPVLIRRRVTAPSRTGPPGRSAA